MSVTATATASSRRRSTGLAAGTALLTLALAGCSGLGRTAVGPVTYTTERDRTVSTNSPSVKGCHKMDSAGANEVENGTLIDMILYRTPDCTGGETIYIPTTVTDVKAPPSGPWLSYRFVH
ncbi:MULTISPECIES: hypothetical protein [unclassified Streptomyces]|uniref:Lipoprotein n=1 Tax=Streptomyces salyersiae TaxID=3075530 RepID=A0ABU2RTX8_9ACTN|nr:MULTISPECIES: hypothetical protein [unclassified Streptomyces]AEN09328.1 conserved hypothetical protein [Streptomyces sp. SirexAA-E]MDT0432295.1 hypothetical protein [Streptomyces sp. DSM 41770]MYR70527.1 hypothetical protein [Streptomyces sp. SID4939]MYS01747.1 hypothetical protein [Streptomyces sp. SID4940]MYT64812.1 hypothetical protein [Streptomyces sp. SID8357]